MTRRSSSEPRPTVHFAAVIPRSAATVIPSAARDRVVASRTLLPSLRSGQAAALVGMTLVLAVHLSAQQSVPTWTLQPELRIGGEADGPKSFVDIRGIGMTKSGNIFVLEFKEQALRVFDRNGNFIRQAARRGAGPGEISNANGLAVGEDDVVWVNDPANGRFSLYRSDGTFLKQVLAQINGYGWVWHGSVVAPDRVFDDFFVNLPTSQTDPATGRPVMDSRVRFVSANGKIDTVGVARCPGLPHATSDALVYGRAERHARAFLAVPFWPYQQVAYTRQSTVWCTPSDEYRLLVGPIGGALREVVHRTFPPVLVSDSERRREMARLDSAKIKFGDLISGDPTAIPRTKPAIAQIVADDLGRVWVLRNGLNAAAPVLEVYDPAGRQVASVVSRGPIGQQVAIVGNSLLTLVLDQDDVPMVVRYRILKARQ